MAAKHLTPMNERSEQEKQEIIAKAQAARKAQKEYLEKYAQEHYRSYEDGKEWERMARELGIRLPRFIDQPTPKNLKKFAKKLGKDTAWIRLCWGVDNLDEIARMNPDMSMRYIAGIMIEDL